MQDKNCWALTIFACMQSWDLKILGCNNIILISYDSIYFGAMRSGMREFRRVWSSIAILQMQCL